MWIVARLDHLTDMDVAGQLGGAGANIADHSMPADPDPRCLNLSAQMRPKCSRL
jgi:hypothetical protein